MALRNRRPLIALMFALLSADSLGAQAPAPLRLSFADAVRQASDQAPQVTAAGLRTDAAIARVRQARSTLLPSLAVSGFWANRSFNSKAQGISFPGVPTVIGPFNSYDGRVRATQTLLDFSSMSRVSAARGLVTAATAERSAIVETAAQNAALAYLRAPAVKRS